jgi:hypothetical protein
LGARNCISSFIWEDGTYIYKRVREKEREGERDRERKREKERERESGSNQQGRKKGMK